MPDSLGPVIVIAVLAAVVALAVRSLWKGKSQDKLFRKDRRACFCRNRNLYLRRCFRSRLHSGFRRRCRLQHFHLEGFCI